MTPRPHRPSSSPFTHYSAWDDPGGRTVRALCGVLMRRAAHQTEPTCPKCQVVIKLREKLGA